MSLLLHISDTHFGTEKPKVVQALLAFAHEHRPDLLVFSGDITQRARPEEFAAAQRFCQQLQVSPMLALPGNHDVPLMNVLGRLLWPYAGYMEVFGPRLDPVLDTPDMLVIGVNTTRAARHKNGEVSDGQIDRVARQLRQDGGGRLKVVVTHQPSAVLDSHDVHDRLRNAEPALQAWSQAGADLVLGGHIHLPYVMDLRARSTPTPRRMYCVQAGTAVSNRIRHGTCNSVNLIHWSSPQPGELRQCTVERCDYDDDAGGFTTADTQLLTLG